MTAETATKVVDPDRKLPRCRTVPPGQDGYSESELRHGVISIPHLRCRVLHSSRLPVEIRLEVGTLFLRDRVRVVKHLVKRSKAKLDDLLVQPLALQPLLLAAKVEVLRDDI